MSYETILYEVGGGVGTITFNRPDKYNAFTQTMYKELLDAQKKLAKDGSVRAVVLTSTGKGFCSGQDLAEFGSAERQGSVGDHLRATLNQVVTNFRALEKPVICAINGVAAGAGASVTTACDLRIASENASFVFGAFLSVGLIPDAGGTYFLPQLIGVSRALELAMLTDGKNRLSAQQALAWGLVNRVVPHDDLMKETLSIANKLAGMPTKAIGLAKRAIYKAAERSMSEALEYEAQLQTIASQTHDHKEGVVAFLEKREPVYKGE